MTSSRVILIPTMVALFVGGLFLLYTRFIKSPIIAVYIENNSFDRPEVDLMVHLDNDLIVIDAFKVDSVSPHFSIHKIASSKGPHILTVKSTSQNLSKSDTVLVVGDTHIFIAYNFRRKTKYQFEQERFKFETLYPKDKFPDKVFIIDSVAVYPEIKIYVTDETPILQ